MPHRPPGPTAGAIRILEIDPLADPVAVKRKIGVVPEDLALFERLTGAETLSFIGQVYGLDAATLRSRSADLLALMSLAEAAGDLVADYSHGMRKKLALAAALLPAPRLLFLDEPFEGIDAVASRQIKDLLGRFVAGGGTIFLTSHILEIVERLCDTWRHPPGEAGGPGTPGGAARGRRRGQDARRDFPGAGRCG